MDSIPELFDKNAIANLIYLLDYTGAKLVISSTWKHDEIELRKVLANIGLINYIYKKSIYDIEIPITSTATSEFILWKTPYHNMYKHDRRDEILDWFEQYTASSLKRISNYIIIDEKDFKWYDYQRKNIINTSYHSGFNKRCLNRAILKLGARCE